MAQVSYRELVPDVAPIVKGCPGPTIIRALQAAAREFFRDSESWVYTIPALDVAALATSLTPSIPSETEIVRPVDMTFQDQHLKTTTVERANAQLGRWNNTEKAVAKPAGIFRLSATELALAPLPSAAVTGALNGTLALTPIRLAAGVEEEFLDEYGDGIADGAIARLAGQRGTDWYAPDILSFYQTKFASAIADAAIRAKNEHTENVGNTGYGGI